MPTTISDLFDYDDEIPKVWLDAIDEIEKAGANRNHVEALKLRMQMALTATRANADLFVNDDANHRADHDAALRKQLASDDAALQRELAAARSEIAQTELKAAEKRADAADAIAKSLTRATWVLAIATGVLVLATIASVAVAVYAIASKTT